MDFPVIGNAETFAFLVTFTRVDKYRGGCGLLRKCSLKPIKSIQPAGAERLAGLYFDWDMLVASLDKEVDFVSSLIAVKIKGCVVSSVFMFFEDFGDDEVFVEISS